MIEGAYTTPHFFSSIQLARKFSRKVCGKIWRGNFIGIKDTGPLPVQN